MLLLQHDACASVINGNAEIPKDVTESAEIKSMLEGKLMLLINVYLKRSSFKQGGRPNCRLAMLAVGAQLVSPKVQILQLSVNYFCYFIEPRVSSGHCLCCKYTLKTSDECFLLSSCGKNRRKETRGAVVGSRSGGSITYPHQTGNHLKNYSI